MFYQWSYIPIPTPTTTTTAAAAAATPAAATTTATAVSSQSQTCDTRTVLAKRICRAADVHEGVFAIPS